MGNLPRVAGAWRLALLISVAACQGGSVLRVNDLTPESITGLEEERARRPADADALARLGVAYYNAARFEDARLVLDDAVARGERYGVAALYLGMASEALGDFAAARQTYQYTAGVAGNWGLEATARGRLALVGRHELEFEARQALAREPVFAELPPEANTVAVMPFSYSGTDPEIRPLTRGLTQLLVTDIATNSGLRVLERERMQAIVNELQLADSALVDPQSALRAGRLLRAALVVQGTLTDVGAGLRADVVVVDVESAGVVASATASGGRTRLFDVAKQLVRSLVVQFGVGSSELGGPTSDPQAVQTAGAQGDPGGEPTQCAPSHRRGDAQCRRAAETPVP